MSMSTPVNELPLRTTTNEDNSDITDPMVQDVLNEFQSELMISQKPPMHQQQMQQMPSMPQQQMLQMPAMPQHMQQAPQAPQHPQTYHVQQQMPFLPKTKQNDFPYSLLDMQILQKTLIIIIIIIIVYHTGALLLIYDKLPAFLYDLCEKFDMYIKIILIFVIIYALFIFAYL